MDKLVYKCGCCNEWEKALPSSWSDISPRFCGNNSCDLSLKKSKGKKSFKSNPEFLIKIDPPKPKKEDQPIKTPEQKVRRKRK